MVGLGRFYQFVVSCRGEVDPQTGYLCDIKAIDRAFHATVTPVVEHAVERGGAVEPAAVLREAFPLLNRELQGAVSGVEWALSPYYRVFMDPNSPNTVVLRHKFDFAASHRLHSPHLSVERNRELFGKCNNPNGHGHNYQVEPWVAVTLGEDGKQAMLLPELERIVNEVLIERFDHKHLNLDTPEFSDRGGVIPSVENIARVFHSLLAPAIERANAGATLQSITVWETDRTSCTYPA